MATVGCPPGYACPTPVQVSADQVIPSGAGWQFLYTPFAQPLDYANSDTQAVAEYMDFAFTVANSGALLGAFQAALSQEFWSSWRQEFVNAGSDMYVAQVYVQPPASYPGYATYRVVVTHSLAFDVFLNFIADVLKLVVASTPLLILLGIVFFGQTIVASLKNLCANVLSDYCHPSGAAKSVYVWITVVGGVAAVGGWYFLNRLSQHEGTGHVAPPAPPGFTQPSIHTNTGVHLGPITQTAGVDTHAGGQAATIREPQGDREARRAQPVMPSRRASRGGFSA